MSSKQRPKNGNDGLSENVNDATYAELKKYEMQRRLTYSSRLDSISLYWKSYRDLLAAGLQETGRAQRLVLGTSRAHGIYAEAMKSIYEDVFLDEKGNITNDKHRKKLAPSRRNVPSSKSQIRKMSVLNDIQKAQISISARFGESSKNMDDEIADAICSLLEDTRKQFSAMENLGSCVLLELEKTEQEVSAAWDRYLPKASLPVGTAPHIVHSNLPQETTPQRADVDSWIVETQYRVAVAYQNAAWEKGKDQLDELFSRVKQEEILRRMNLREFLVAFVQRQQRLFSSLPTIQNSALESLVGLEFSREETESNIASIVKSRVEKYRNEAGTGDTEGVLSGDAMADGSLDLESPLTSDLLSKAKIVKRRGNIGGVTSKGTPGSDWKTSLAVLTADSYLHFFDVDDSRVVPGSPPETAFQVLMPNVVIPTSDSLLLGKSNFSKGWGDTLAPTESFTLAKCSIQPVDATLFVVTEKGGASAASKMFGKLVDRKVQIKTQTKGETDDWISSLTS